VTEGVQTAGGVMGGRISSVGGNPEIVSGRVVVGQTAGGGGQKTTSALCFEQGRLCGGSNGV